MRLKFRGAKRLGFAAASLSGLAAATTLLTGPASPAAAQGTATCPNADIRAAQNAEHLPDCRAYEQVSPVDKNGSDVFYDVQALPEGGGQPVAPDGGAAVFRSFGSFAGQPFGPATEPTAYLSFRSGDGWETITPFPRPQGSLTPRISLDGTSADLRTVLLTPFNGPVGPDPAGGAQSLYRLDTETGALDLLFTPDDDNDNVFKRAATRDLATVAFEVDEFLGPKFAYLWREGQGTELAGVDQNGDPFPSSQLGSGRLQVDDSAAGALSEDGSHVFFSAPAPSTNLPDDQKVYRRTGGQTTELASPTELATPDPQGPFGKQFVAATGDGNRVFFMSAEQLTGDANTGPTRDGNDLYRYDFAADDLIDISATAGGDGARVLGVLGYSENGERVYYAARGQVVAGEGTPGEANVYLWEDDGTPGGETTFVATLDPADESDWSWTFDRTTRATADGRYLVFESRKTLPGAPRNHDGVVQVYRYDAAGGELTCVSCPQAPPAPQEPPAGDAIVAHCFAGLTPRQCPRALSADGSRVFFDTSEALVARDVNGEVDAYLWQGGRHYLLGGSGTRLAGSHFQGASADGDSAFFVSPDRLAASDGDNAADLYVARVNGGFPAPPAPAPCAGDACQGPAPEPPAPAEPSSAGFSTPGNEPAGQEQPQGEAKRCAALERRAGKAKRRAGRAKRAFKHARRKARRAEGKRAKRLGKRAERKQERFKKKRRKARRALRKARSCAASEARQAGRRGR